MVSSLISKYDVLIVILMPPQLKKVEGLHCFFVFGWIKLKFGVKGNLGLSFQILAQKLSIGSKS